MANWQAFSDLWNQGSFVSQVPAPNAEPGDAPTICVQFNAAWLPFVMGAIFQLTQPSAWDPTSTGYADVLAQAQSLMGIFSAAEVCTDMLQFQFTDTCGLQYSVDGGATWIDVPGWDTFASTCFKGDTGATGATGATGPAYVGQGSAPPNPQGATPDQQACNIAGYLAAQLIQMSIQSAVDSVNASKTIVDAVAAGLALIPGVDITVGLVTGALALLVNAVVALSTAPFEAALTDVTLWSDMQCAIYNAIQPTGYVTAANFAAIVDNIAAISYTDPDVITTIAAYVDASGADTLMYQQNNGSLYVGDCSSCGGYCYESDFTAGQDIWDIYGAPTDPEAIYVPGTGYTSLLRGGQQELTIECLTTAKTLTEIRVMFEAAASGGSAARYVQTYLAGSLVNTYTIPDAAAPTPTVFDTGAISDTTDQILIRIFSTSTSALNTIIAAELFGDGPNPFGADNCTF